MFIENCKSSAVSARIQKENQSIASRDLKVSGVSQRDSHPRGDGSGKTVSLVDRSSSNGPGSHDWSSSDGPGEDWGSSNGSGENWSGDWSCRDGSGDDRSSGNSSGSDDGSGHWSFDDSPGDDWSYGGNSGLTVDDSVETVDGIGGVVDDASAAVGFDERVAALDDVTGAGLVLGLRVTGDGVLHVVGEAVLGGGVQVLDLGEHRGRGYGEHRSGLDADDAGGEAEECESLKVRVKIYIY